MTNERLLQLSQALAVGSLALFAGLFVATKGVKMGLALGLLPIAIAIGLLVLRRPSLLGYFLLGVFFTNLDVILSRSMESKLAFIWFGMSFAYFGLVFLARDQVLSFGTPVKAYLLFFAIVTLLIAVSPYTRELPLENWIRRTAYGLNAFLLAYLLLSSEDRLRKAVYLITWAGVLLSVINIIEFTDRSVINLSSLPGRSAGLLYNPNASAAAILASFVISYLYPQKFILVARLLMFAGIYTTFSRGALILFWPLAFLQEMRTRKLSFRQIVLTMALVSGVVLLTTYSTILIEDYSSDQVQKAYSRVARMKEGRFDDASTRQRINVIGINLQRFVEHPIIGGGAGSASVNDAPHNQFLLIMAEFGSIGAVLYTAFVILLLVQLLRIEGTDERQKLLLVYAYTVSYLLFSHNAIYLRFHIIMTALLCAATEIFKTRAPAGTQRPSLRKMSASKGRLLPTKISPDYPTPTEGQRPPGNVR